MSEFQIWFITGFEHIADYRAIDHIAFLLALTIMFKPEEWKQLLIQITAFTVGHSLTLALSAWKLIVIKQNFIELLIPFTILVTAVMNLKNLAGNSEFAKTNYLLALVFGLVHGMGFSYILIGMLGRSESITLPLLSFNMGIEAGQLLIVSFLSIIAILLVRFLKIPLKKWQMSVSVLVLILAVYLIIERI